MALTEDGPPDRESWHRLIETLDGHYDEIDRLRAELAESRRGWSSFENLFRMSPIPLMEQDYTEIEEWMDGLRAQGVESLRKHLGEDVEALRAIVPMIRMVAANPAAVRAVGLPIEEMMGPIDPQIVNEGSQESWLSQLEAVWNREPEAHAYFTAATASGDTFDAESFLSAPIVEGEPDFSRAVFTLNDVTPHRKEERRMHEVMETKNRFLASVSHEIRTPLTAILGFARLLTSDETLSEGDRRLMVSSIVQHSQEVADLVEDLLVAARVEHGQVDVACTAFDVTEQVDETIRAGGSFTTDVRVLCQEGCPPALGDPVRVRQIVRNLLTNAERYGGSDVSVEISSSEGLVCVEVLDDGPGLPDAEWERIFEPYHRAHENLGQPESVGIGLAISRQLAELMGGSLRYSREAGLSVFHFCLPMADAQPG